MSNINLINKTPAIAGVLFILLLTSRLYSQETVTQYDVAHKFSMYDVNGKPFVNPYTDVAGTPFFPEQWNYGIIKSRNNSTFRNIQLRLDFQKHEVHFKKADNIEMVADIGAIKEINLFDSSGNIDSSYIFRSGFPKIDKQNENSFYQVLSLGKIGFLKSIKKGIYQYKDPLSGEIQKEFREYDDYYFYVQDKMYRIKRDKSFVTDFMKDKSNQIEAFLQANKISFKSMEDIKKLVGYYNSMK